MPTQTTSFTTFYQSSCCTRPFLPRIALLLLMQVAVSIAQEKSFNTLGVVTQFELPSVPLFPLLFHSPGDSVFSVAYVEGETGLLVKVTRQRDGSFDGREVLAHVSNVTFMTAADLNGDGRSDFVIVHREAAEIEVLSSADTSYRSVSYKVNFYPDKVALTDLDNDSTMDIVSFGKLSTGASFLRGQKGGAFEEPKLLFPEIPVAEFYPLRLNEDEFPDVAVHNWLTNEVILYYGMGDLQFSEQNVLSFGKDTVAVVFGDFNRDRVMDYAAASNDEAAIRLYAGDGIGGYSLYQTLDCHYPQSEFRTAPVHGKQSVDLIAQSRGDGIITIFSNYGDGSFAEPVFFGCPSTGNSILFADTDHDGWNDIFLFRSDANAVLQYSNANKRFNLTRSISKGIREVHYAVGKTPGGIMVADFNGDGLDDIAVVNRLSSTLSLLYNAAGFVLNSQISLQTVESPSFLRLYSRTDTVLTFILTHPSEAKVSVLAARQNIRQNSPGIALVTTYGIPTAENPRVFLPDASLQEKMIEFYVYSSAKQNSLSYFRQLEGGRFIERNFKPIIPARLLTAAVSDFNADGRPDLAYVYQDAGLQRYNLGITFSDSTGQYRGQTLSSVFPDSLMKKCFIMFEDVNGDNVPDCIVSATPSNTVRLAIGKGGGFFEDFLTVALSVSVAHPEHIQALDFDGDGILDIVVLDEKSSELSLYRGKGNGRFFPKEYLLDLPQNTSFRFGDFNSDGTLDIAYSDPERDVVSVYFFKRNPSSLSR